MVAFYGLTKTHNGEFLFFMGQPTSYLYVCVYFLILSCCKCYLSTDTYPVRYTLRETEANHSNGMVSKL